jgi:hypothetical protein
MFTETTGANTQMCSVYDDVELHDWLRWAEENGPSFLRTIAEAAFAADLKNYNLIRPALLKLKEATPKDWRGHARPRSREKPRPIRPPHPMPTVWLVTQQRRSLVVHLRPRMEHVRYRSSVPRMPPSVDFDAVPLV